MYTFIITVNVNTCVAFVYNYVYNYSMYTLAYSVLYIIMVSDDTIVHLGLNVNTSAHNCGCVVDGGNAMAV